MKNKKPVSAKAVRNTVQGYVFLSPLIVGLALFTFYPVFKSLLYSFTDYSVFKEAEFVGFGNYVKAFSADSEMGKVWANTAIYAVVSIPLNLVLSYFLAVLVNREFACSRVLRVLYYLPVVIPGVVSGVLWKALLNDADGIFNQIFAAVGLPKNTFFSEAKTSMFSVIFMSLWGIGGSMILWLSAFRNIPDSVYEAAEIDGAGVLTKVFRITVPLSTSMIFYNLIMGIIGAMQINSTLIYAPRNGRGYENSVYFIGIKIYREAFVRWDLGYASAIAWLLFAVIAVLTGIAFLTNKLGYYGDAE